MTEPEVGSGRRDVRQRSGSVAEDDELRTRYRELLEELRTIMPGVQVLFGFLLIVPFSSRFGDVDAFGVRAFTVALVAASLATVVMLTPAAYHRMRGPGDRRDRIQISIRAQLAGMSLLAVATVDAVFVVVRFLLGTVAGGLAAGLVAVVIATMWWLLPSLRR